MGYPLGVQELFVGGVGIRNSILHGRIGSRNPIFSFHLDIFIRMTHMSDLKNVSIEIIPGTTPFITIYT